ncbi:MAG: glycosyltransferase [Acidobacteriia bacterium]|nr:glycosyltransferase [Terriglobia bacterium]
MSDYAPIVGRERIDNLRRLARRLEGLKVVVVNSTRVGGGVAEMLNRHVPLFGELGIAIRWEIVEGTPEFFEATKTMHNALQGAPRDLTPALRAAYLETNRRNAGRLDFDADVVVIHDPQPAALIDHATRTCPWVWRCHIDASRPHRSVWRFLRGFISRFDASVFSMPAFAQNLPHPQYVIAPSIDPLAPKNRDMEEGEVDQVLARFGLDRSRPLIVQVSRFDRFKDPVGVVRAFRMVRRRDDCRLVLAGGGAADDPEGAQVLGEVIDEVGDDPDVTILELPPESDREINALQRAATIIVQKSTREGFGLTVTEGLWKGRPVIGGAAGGIKVQVYDHMTGFLVHSPEGLAYRLRYLLNRPGLAEEMGARGRELVRHHFLLTRHLRDQLTLFLEVTGRAAG